MTNNHKTLRVAAYMRYSSENQRGNTSLDVQLRMITNWAQQRGAIIVSVFTDEALSGKGQAKRTDLQRLKVAAADGEFDAVVVALWDRLGRNDAEGRALKQFLRDDCKVAVYAAEGASEDDDPVWGGFIEGVQSLNAELYSNELSRKFKRARYEIFLAGFYGGSHRPFGYDIEKIPVGTNRYGLPVTRKSLTINEYEAKAVLLAYETYATGKYSYDDVAKLLNKAGYRTTRGGLFGHDSIQKMLESVLYLGMLTYQESRHNKTRSKRYWDNPLQTRPGRHPAIITQELYDKVQDMKAYRKFAKHGACDKDRAYMLQGLCWCWHCYQARIEAKPPLFGKMSCHSAERNYGAGIYSYYKCSSHRRGYDCPQKKVRVEGINQQVLDVLFSLRVPADWRKRLVTALAADLKDKSIEARIEELRGIAERMDEMYAYGLVIDKADFLTKRAALQAEYEKLQPAVNTDLYQAAADLIDNFKRHFEACGDDTDAQNRLISRVVERIFVRGKEVVAIMFKADCHAVLHYGGEIARYYIGGKPEEIDRVQDTGLLQTQEALETETQAALEADRLYQELKAAYPEATDDEIQDMLISGSFRGTEQAVPPPTLPPRPLSAYPSPQ